MKTIKHYPEIFKYINVRKFSELLDVPGDYIYYPERYVENLETEIKIKKELLNLSNKLQSTNTLNSLIFLKSNKFVYFERVLHSFDKNEILKVTYQMKSRTVDSHFLNMAKKDIDLFVFRLKTIS